MPKFGPAKHSPLLIQNDTADTCLEKISSSLPSVFTTKENVKDFIKGLTRLFWLAYLRDFNSNKEFDKYLLHRVMNMYCFKHINQKNYQMVLDVFRIQNYIHSLTSLRYPCSVFILGALAGFFSAFLPPQDNHFIKQPLITGLGILVLFKLTGLTSPEHYFFQAYRMVREYCEQFGKPNNNATQSAASALLPKLTRG